MNECNTTRANKTEALEKFGLSDPIVLPQNLKPDGFRLLTSRRERRKQARECRRLSLKQGVLSLALICVALAGCGTITVQEATEIGTGAGAIYSEIEHDPEKLISQAEQITTVTEAINGDGERATILGALILLSDSGLDLGRTELAILNGWILEAVQEVLTTEDREALSMFLVSMANGMLDGAQLRRAAEDGANQRINEALLDIRERLDILLE